MRPTQIIKALNTLIEAKQPVMIHGAPGVGKSDVVRQVAKQKKMQMIDLRLSQLDPVDLRGVPSVEANKTHWNRPSFLPTSGKGILFLDEINSAAQATQAAAYQLVLDRQLGEYTMPEGWVIIAAGNRTTDQAIVNQMSTALKNRFVHLDYEVNNDDWCSWAFMSNVVPEIISFIRFRPNLLNEFEKRNDSKEEKNRVNRIRDSQAFATPRSWEFLSRIIHNNPPSEIEYELFSGVVGEGAAAEFIGYLKTYRSLPNLDDVLKKPFDSPVPNEPAVLYAVATGLITKMTKKNIDNLVEYALRMPKEFQAMMLRDAEQKIPDIANTKAFTRWTVNNAEVLI